LPHACTSDEYCLVRTEVSRAASISEKEPKGMVQNPSLLDWQDKTYLKAESTVYYLGALQIETSLLISSITTWTKFLCQSNAHWVAENMQAQMPQSIPRKSRLLGRETVTEIAGRDI